MTAGSSFGHLFRISTFGESHGGSVGVVIDGCPPGLAISKEEIQAELDRRRPGQSAITTPRKVHDLAVESTRYDWDGIIVEVHPNPKDAWTDARQQITWDEFDHLISAMDARELQAQSGGVKLRVMQA